MAVSLNDELSLAVDAFRSEVQTARPAARRPEPARTSSSGIKGSPVASTEELSRTTVTLAKELADMRERGPPPTGDGGEDGFIYRDLMSTPFMTEPMTPAGGRPGPPGDGLRAAGIAADVAGFERCSAARVNGP